MSSPHRIPSRHPWRLEMKTVPFRPMKDVRRADNPHAATLRQPANQSESQQYA